MKALKTEELYQLFTDCGGKVCTDSRKLVDGALFVCLKGPNFNANHFAQKAVEEGCKFAIVDEEEFADHKQIFFVENSLHALQNLANFHRKRFNIPVLGITGSNAKTTHKELIHAVISKKYNTLYTRGNLNNHIGVPLTLLNLNESHEFAIIEMGANHQGEIDELSRIAEPDFGLITNIGKAHLEGFGGIEGVKKGKSELYRFIKEKQGKIFINGDDEVLHDLAKENDKISYGTTKLFDVIGKQVLNGETVSLKWTTRYGEKDWTKRPLVQTQITGMYNFINCLASVCVGNYFQVSEEEINEALENYVPDMNRSQIVKTANNKILLDAYNANPNSMQAAIDNFSKVNAGNKWLLLGDMFELGEFSREEHQLIIDLLKQKKLENVLLVGKEFSAIAPMDYKTFLNTEDCKLYLKQNPVTNAFVLIKGSRGMKMEILQDVL